MDYSSIFKDIKEIKNEIEALCQTKIEDESINISVAEFSSLVESIKKHDILDERKDSMYFKNVFDNEDYYKNISIYLDQIIRKISIKTEKKGVSLEVSDMLAKACKNIKFIIGVLTVEYGNLLKEDSKRWISRNGGQRRKIKTALAELIEFQKKLDETLKTRAVVISNVILKEFKMLYKFFLYSIKLAKERHDELLLVEIAGMTDKIISMIEPIFSDESLKTDELIYYYLTYELKELKVDSIGEKLS
ncbi:MULTISPECIES: imidazole glycerol phosphate synthase [unclassified Campylobacter]|uniref:imidazole glycerol phosphate synthase n=1 Tax=Campylobacter TaxID=194 RepID=UPI001475D845|nr:MULTISPECIES: imidazole glycerol phosphate synthase [unclassified Campylobacter]